MHFVIGRQNPTRSFSKVVEVVAIPHLAPVMDLVKCSMAVVAVEK